MPLLNDDDVKITELTKQIVEDYLIYSHSTESLISYGCKDEEIIKDCRFRQTITTHIMNMECENALQLIKTHKMYKKNDQIIDLLYKQLFIECVYKKDYSKAIGIASEYMASGKSDKNVFSILGYKNDKQLIEQLCGKARRRHCCEKVNDLMLEMVNGKKKNMLWYLCNQQASIVHYSQ